MQDIKDIIKRSQLFWRLSDNQVDKVAAVCEKKTCGIGTRIFTAGDKARHLYIVQKGRVSLELMIRIGSRTKRQVTIDTITKAQVLGWPALFPEKPAYTMSATTTEDTELIALDGDAFQKLSRNDADLGFKVMRELVILVSGRLAHATETLAHVLSVTSHDLKAPLATVKSSLEAITGGFVGKVNDRQEDLLQGCSQRITDLLHMIDNILDISHVEISQLDFRKISLREVILSSLGDVQGMAQQKGIELRNEVPAGLPQVVGSSNRLRQVLTNLLSNAIKFTPAGGVVTIGSRETENVVEIDVKDTGVGISPEELPRIFDDFYRGMKMEEVEGAGIGLSISKKIIEAHGGLIWAESPDPKTGKGTRIAFNLPKVLPDRAKVKEEAAAAETARILVADDDPQMRKVTTLVLESAGYQVSTARDGQEALAMVKEKKPDLLILDILMPVVDGFDVLKQISKQPAPRDGKETLIMVLSAVKEESSRRRYELETGKPLPIHGYLEKPVSPPALLQCVEKLLQSKANPAVKR